MEVKDSCAQVSIAGEDILLTPQKTFYWPSKKIMAVADMHLGKTALFRQHGISVPKDVMVHDLARLSQALACYPTQQLVVVGDMFHKDFNTDLHLFEEWRQRHNGLEILLVKGNHDRLHNLQYMHFDIALYNQNLNIFPFQFVHAHKKPADGFFSISGHVHPGVRLVGKAKQAIKLPCFRLSQDGLILPAFSTFTGLDVSRCAEACTYYAVLQDAVLELNN